MTKISNKDQRKGMLLAFTGIMFITPDSLLIRLADIDSWNLIFYRGFIPFLTILIGLLFIYKSSLIKKILNNGWHVVDFILTFAITSSVFVVSIETTNTVLVMAKFRIKNKPCQPLSRIFLNKLDL